MELDMFYFKIHMEKHTRMGSLPDAETYYKDYI